jgi:hypothetical protein
MSYARHLKRKRIPIKYVIFMKDMYIDVVTSVRAYNSESIIFSIKIKLHQGSILSIYVFILVMDDVIKDMQWDIYLCILFADDVVMIDESKMELIRN